MFTSNKATALFLIQREITDKRRYKSCKKSKGVTIMEKKCVRFNVFFGRSLAAI